MPGYPVRHIAILRVGKGGFPMVEAIMEPRYPLIPLLTVDKNGIHPCILEWSECDPYLIGTSLESDLLFFEEGPPRFRFIALHSLAPVVKYGTSAVPLLNCSIDRA